MKPVEPKQIDETTLKGLNKNKRCKKLKTNKV